MHLLELDLPDYRGLRDFHLDLTEAPDVAVLVGRNARGKSRVLHALVEIFGSLWRRKPAAFPYRIRYIRGGSTVVVVQKSASSPPLMRAANGQSEATVRRSGWHRYLPDHLFGYQVVQDSYWNEEFRRHLDDALARLRGHGLDSPEAGPDLRPVLQCEVRQLPLILLALLPQWAEKYGPHAEDAVGITGFAWADLTVSRPGWARGSRYTSQPYWALGDQLPQLFDRLASVGRFGAIPDASTPSTYNEFRISLRTPEDLDALLGLFSADLTMFATFERLQAAGLLRADVRLTMVDGTQIKPEDLSAGEQQMLTILGMLRLQRGRESLFLLDEPAAHFHPGWSQRWYSSVRAMLEDGQQSQFIASTHDPALVLNIPREQIRLFRRVDDRITADIPTIDPQGHGIGELLTTELWGLASQLDEHTQRLIDDQHELAGYPELTDSEREQLRKLNEELDTLDFATERRDPVVTLFLSELARRRRALIEAASSENPPSAGEFEAMVSYLFDERFSRGL